MHVHRCKRKHNLSITCTKCQSPLTNTHILGGCRYTAKLRTKRHNSTFCLLHQHLQKSNGGRYGPYARTWAKNLSPTLATLWQTSNPPLTLPTKGCHTPYKKACKTTNRRTPITHNPYQTTYYTLNTNPNTISRTSSVRWDSCSTHRTN